MSALSLRTEGPKRTTARRLFLTWAAAVLLLAPDTGLPADFFYQTVRIALSGGFFYGTPDDDAEPAGKIERGDRVTLIDEKGEWYGIRLQDDRLGWVRRSLFIERGPLSLKAMEPEEPSAATPPETAPPRPPPSSAAPAPAEAPEMADSYPVRLKVPSGRVRETPSLDAKVEFGLTRGQEVTVMASRDGWYRIRLADGRKGWAHKSLFHAPGETLPYPESRPAPAPPPEEPAPRPTPSPEPAPEEAAPERPAQSPPAGEPAEKVMADIRVEVSPDGSEKAIFVLNGFYPPETFVLEEGIPKVVCDFFYVSPAPAVDRRMDVNGDFIRQIRTGIHRGPPPKLRVVVDLEPNRDYDVQQVYFKQDNTYVLTFTPSSLKGDA